MSRVYLFLAASAGCLVLAGIVLAGPSKVLYAIAPETEVAQCSRLLDRYEETKSYPERGTEEFKRYSHCYYVACGIRL